MITSDTDSPLVAFIKAQVPIAERLADGIRVDHATLCALVEAHHAWAQTHLPSPTGTAEPLEADVTAVAALFKRSRSWVYLQLTNDRFPGAYVDRRGAHRFPQSCLDAFTAAERTALPATPPAATGSRTSAAQRPTTPVHVAEEPQATATAPVAPALAETGVVTRPSPTAAAERTSVAAAARRTPSVAAKAPTTPNPAAGPRPARPRATASNATSAPSTPATLTWDAWRAGRAAAGATG